MYPLGHYTKGKTLFLSSVHILQGEEKNKKKFLNYLKKNKKVSKIEISQNIIFLESKENLYKKEFELVYDPKLFHPTPVINTIEGDEIWEVACWNRKPLENLIKFLRKSKAVSYFELLKFVEKNLEDVYLLQLLPKLSPKQRQAIELAYSKGYYRFPKKTDLNKLARIMKISKVTFREYLKKAEAKLMPLLLRKNPNM